MMNDLFLRLQAAKTDNAELNRLISDYIPFIKKEVSKTPVFQMDFDDRLSIAMLVFMNCVRQYDENAGMFLPFAATCIRNRLIDEGKKLSRHNSKILPIFHDENLAEIPALAEISMQQYEKEQERVSLSEEIDALSSAMNEFGITFKALSKICPKQNRSRKQCVMLAQEIVSDPQLKEHFFKTHRIPQTELAKRFMLSEKTIEKHRKYIVAVTLILSGNYPGIQAFLPEGGGVE